MKTPKTLSDTPKTDAIWPEFWEKFPKADKRVAVYFDMLLRKQEREAIELRAALQLYLDFLGSLPKGWLSKTNGDIGLLNDAYIASGKLGTRIT